MFLFGIPQIAISAIIEVTKRQKVLAEINNQISNTRSLSITTSQKLNESLFLGNRMLSDGIRTISDSIEYNSMQSEIRRYDETAFYLRRSLEQLIELQDKTRTFITLGAEHANVNLKDIFKIQDEIVKLGDELGVELSKTYSCYTNNQIHCGSCLACRLRQEGFYWANIKDDTEYLEKMEDYRGVE